MKIMKRIVTYIALALSLVLVSCKKEQPIPVYEYTDLYTAPSDAQVMSAPTAKSVWSTDRRYFELTFGSDLVTTLVGFDALLAPGQYVLGADEIGKAILAKTKVKGAAAKSGFITVNENKGNYTITAQIDGNVLTWTGALPFKADPDPVQLSVCIYATKNATGTVSAYLGEPAVAVGGNGKYLVLELASPDGYLHAGSYAPSAEGGVAEAGQFVSGWDNEAWGDWGKNQGTCLFTVTDGASVGEKITEGMVFVEEKTLVVEDKEVDGWRISWGVQYPVEVLFEGEIAALTKPKTSPDFAYTYAEADLQAVTDQAGATVSGVMKHPVSILDANGQTVAYFEMLLAEGETELEGEYVSTSYATEPGMLADGWEFDASAWGMGIMSGGSYFTNAAGEKVLMYASQWTLQVKKLVLGAYEFVAVPVDPSAEGFSVKASGPNYVPGSYKPEGGEGGEEEDVTGDVVLKITSGLTYTMEDVTAGNTDSSQQPLSGMTLWRVTVSDGSGTVAAFDLGTAEGSSDLAGEYSVMSYPNAVGKAGNGWGFASWNFFGGCYFIADGAYYFIPEGATIHVSNNANGTLKIKFEGAIQKDDYSDGGQGGLLLSNIAKS